MKRPKIIHTPGLLEVRIKLDDARRARVVSAEPASEIRPRYAGLSRALQPTLRAIRERHLRERHLP